MMRPSKSLSLILCILIPLTIGGSSGFSTMESITTWYVTLNKPSFNPPNHLFGPVWSTLYVLMGISLFLVLYSPSKGWRIKAITIFSIQLSLNFIWSFIFFKYHQLGIAFVEILLMWFSILAMILIFYKINKTAAYLQIPYLLWVTFASILNYAIWQLN